MHENDAPRILIVRLSALGDVLHSTTVVHHLRECYPKAHITWLVSPPADQLLQHNPDIDEILCVDRRRIDTAFAKKNFREVLRWLKEARALLQAHTFDIALDIQGLFLSGLLTRFSGAPKRIGIHERHEGNFLFMTQMAKDIPNPHKIYRYMTALSPLGLPTEDFKKGLILRLTEKERAWAKEFWRKKGIVTDNPSRPLLLVNTRTTWPDKNWPADRFGKAVRDLPESVQIVFTGASQDSPYIEAAQREIPRTTLSIAGETSLRQLCAIIESADFMLTGDTGPLYMAEAVGTKTLSLWGPTMPSIYGPLTKGQEFILSPHNCTACCKTKCRHHNNACINAISVEAVTKRLQEHLGIPH